MSESDIRTIIESDVDYRKRLLTTDWARHIGGRELLIEPLCGAVLDGLGVVHGMPRKHTHICSPPKGQSND
jgi:hypothetical protein